MGINDEIERAFRIITELNKNAPFKTKDEQESIISRVKTDFENSKYDFKNMISMTLTQNEKKRFIKQYKDIFSSENILCQCIKQILDRNFKIKYPNRNKITHNLFNILPAVVQMTDFTIVKFDFKDFFNSISSIYVYKKYICENLLNREEKDLVSKFVHMTKYTYAGLCTSNVIAEIIAYHFDKFLLRFFSEFGLIFYERYIDDCILILNEHMDEEEIKQKLNTIRLKVFHDDGICSIKCRTRFNNKKFQYISHRSDLAKKRSFDFLGYEFWLKIGSKKKISIEYGITKSKIEKYRKKIRKIISSYKDKKSIGYKDFELLRHRIKAFSSREVYVTKRFHFTIWHEKGFISTYRELRYLLEQKRIEKNTSDFLKYAFFKEFKAAKVKIPYYLTKEKGYNLFENMKLNKTILLVKGIGYDRRGLVKLCKQIGISEIDAKGKKQDYDSLVKDYLFKVCVGY
ncbi:uncharacterized protein BN794_00577 [Coprobacillus sp. CAG:826]|nr:uncharacterized protein BN794_00577 [Coprobacillus sp. CAG:826]